MIAMALLYTAFIKKTSRLQNKEYILTGEKEGTLQGVNSFLSCYSVIQSIVMLKRRTKRNNWYGSEFSQCWLAHRMIWMKITPCLKLWQNYLFVRR